MELRPLGSSGILLSPIGVGTVKIGRNEGVKYPSGFSLPDDARVETLLKTAADLGVNLLDTAPAYGTSESRLGEIMARNGWFGSRGRWFVSTKAGEEFIPAADSPTGRAESRFDFSPEAVNASVRRSLARLRTEYLDAALLHSDGRDEWIMRASGGWDALVELQRQGIVRAIGISTKSAEGTVAAINAMERLTTPRVIMMTLNAADRTETANIEHAHALGIGVFVKKALLSGHIEQIRQHAPTELARSNNEPVEASCRVVFAHEGISSMIVGTTNPDHLAHAAHAVARVLSATRSA